jgi:chromosome segregation ATPase
MTDAALETCKEYLGQLRVNVRAAQEAADRQKEDLDNLTAQLQEKTEGIQEFRSKEVRAVVRPCVVRGAELACSCRSNSRRSSASCRRRRRRTSGRRSTTRMSMTSWLWRTWSTYDQCSTLPRADRVL